MPACADDLFRRTADNPLHPLPPPFLYEEPGNHPATMCEISKTLAKLEETFAVR